MSVLREQTEASLVQLRRLRDTTPILGLRIWLAGRITEIEFERDHGRVLPKPVRLYRPKSMRRIRS